jgi:hypothetical protein
MIVRPLAAMACAEVVRGERSGMSTTRLSAQIILLRVGRCILYGGSVLSHQSLCPVTASRHV